MRHLDLYILISIMSIKDLLPAVYNLTEYKLVRSMKFIVCVNLKC